MNIKLQSLILILCLLGTCDLITFKFERGLKFKAYIGVRANVPTIYQCAQICLSLKLCKALNFDRKNKICHIATRTKWDMGTNSDFLYADRTKIPKELGGSCGNHSCGEYEVCIQTITNKQHCVPFYQCLDGIMVKSYCQFIAAIGGCDESNIGAMIGNNITWFYGLWLYVEINCKRSCFFCNEIF